MLRWLVLGLLFGNVIYFAWQYRLAPESSTLGAHRQAQGSMLRLLSEVVSANDARPVGTPTGAQPAEPVTRAPVSEVPVVPVCHMIGPFKEKISARQIRDRLQSLEIGVNTYQVNILDKPDYWVHLGPLRSRKEALDVLRELQSKKIDSFLISDGELVNGISLGFYTKEELAQAVLKQRREQGYDAKIRQVPRSTQELWVVFARGQYEKFSDELWQQVKSGTQGLELRKNSCDVIASAERLD